MAFSASGLIAGRNPLKIRPFLLRARPPEGVPEEGERGVLVLFPAPTVLAVDDPRLLRVEREPDLAHPLSDPVQQVLRLTMRGAVHDRIVGIALKRAARELPGHPGIERVVHEQVRQDRRNRRPLRSSLGPLLKGTVGAFERGSQPPLHIQQRPAAIGNRPNRFDHEVPRNRVEELLDVEIDHPVVLPAPLPARRQRLMGRLVRSVAIGVGVEPMVRPLLQMHGHDRLRDPVSNRRDGGIKLHLLQP